LHLRRGNATDDRSRPIKYDPIVGDNADTRDVFAAGRAQYCKSISLSYKSGPSTPKSMLGSFKNPDVVAILAEQDRREEPAQRPTDDPYTQPLHVGTLPCGHAARDRSVLAAEFHHGPSRGCGLG
jgi:hypothetical protein